MSTDLVHTVDVPTLDPRNWSVLAGLKASTIDGGKTRIGAGETRTDAGETGTEAGETPKGEPPAGSETTSEAKPVGVSIDILDEGHSLKLAIRRLATDEKLRAALGSNARALWSERFRLQGMVEGYQDAIARALQTKTRAFETRAILPLHLRSSGAEHAESLVNEILGSEYHLRDAD